MKTCETLQQADRGRVIDCNRPAKYVLPDGRGVCGIHARYMSDVARAKYVLVK